MSLYLYLAGGVGRIFDIEDGGFSTPTDFGSGERVSTNLGLVPSFNLRDPTQKTSDGWDTWGPQRRGWENPNQGNDGRTGWSPYSDPRWRSEESGWEEPPTPTGLLFNVSFLSSSLVLSLRSFLGVLVHGFTRGLSDETVQGESVRSPGPASVVTPFPRTTLLTVSVQRFRRRLLHTCHPSPRERDDSFLSVS